MIALPRDAFLQRIDAAVALAVQTLSPGRWSRLPAVVTAGEAARLAKTVRTWLDEFDRFRPPFTVAAVEASRPLALGGLRWTLRLDRIDTLADGGTAIIDYKTGKVAAPANGSMLARRSLSSGSIGSRSANSILRCRSALSRTPSCGRAK
jgi:RecB family exonuclease